MVREPKKHRSVKTIEKFVGWDKLEDLVRKAQAVGESEAALVAILFTGGFRISEAVRSDHGGLKPNHIVIYEANKVLRFVEVPIMKRYTKIAGTGKVCHNTGPHQGHAVWDEDHKHFKTERRTGKEIVRNCSVPLFEPFVGMIQEYADKTPKGQYLFDFNRWRAYRVIEKLDSSIWPHWFRSQRARQLGEYLQNGGYEWNKEKIKQWFKWTNEETAEVYAYDDSADKLEGSFPGKLIR